MTGSLEVGTASARGASAVEWWRRIHDPEKGDAGARARLRRSRTAMDALTIPAALSLARRLGAMSAERQPWRLEAALGLARVLAHVTKDGPDPVMRVVGWKVFPGDTKGSDGDPTTRPRLSEPRFRRLIQAAPGEELTLMMIRLVHLVREPISVRALAQDYLAWRYDSTRYRWAFDYYAAAGAPAPDDTLPAEEDRA